jgi:hypothetical protein
MAGKPARERFLESVGGALYCLTLVVPGLFLAFAGGKKKGGAYRPPAQPRSSSAPTKDPNAPEPVAPQLAPRVVGTDGKIALTCLACFAEVRVEVPFGVSVVTCPKCEREIRVLSP